MLIIHDTAADLAEFALSEHILSCFLFSFN